MTNKSYDVEKQGQSSRKLNDIDYIGDSIAIEFNRQETVRADGIQYYICSYDSTPFLITVKE